MRAYAAVDVPRGTSSRPSGGGAPSSRSEPRTRNTSGAAKTVMTAARSETRAAGPTASRMGSAHHAASLRAMDIAANVVIGLVAVLHLYFLVLEMFLWRTP